MGVILAPVDIEDPSLAILRKACGLAHDLGDSLTLLYVYELPSYAYAEGTVLPATLPRRIEAAARDALEGAAAQLGGSGVSIEVRVEHGGHPAETIARCAASSVAT